MISVITPTIRESGLALVEKALRNQDIDEFEWLICSPFDPKIDIANWIPDTFKGGFWTMNRAMKELIARASGEYIVSWQDNIWAKPDMLSRLIAHAEQTGGLVTPVGDQYDKLDEYGRPTHKVWSDPRKTDKYGTFYECTFPDIEWNLCICPHWAIADVGGIDTELDFRGFGGDMYQINERLNDKGYHFFIDQTLETYTLRHGRERKDWDEKHIMFNGEYEKRKEELKAQGKWI